MIDVDTSFALATIEQGIPAQAQSDEHLIDLWLRLKRSSATRKAYRADIDRFLTFVGPKPLAHITLSELLDYQESLTAAGLAVTSIGRMLAAVKSLLSFGADLRYLPFNTGRALKPDHAPNDLAERILSEEQALAMITLTAKPRDRMLIRLTYVTGARVSEIVALKWRNVQSSPVGGQVALYGKGGKTRVVAIKAETFDQLAALRSHREPQAGPDDPVFLSQKGGQLDVSQAWRIIRAACERAGRAVRQPALAQAQPRKPRIVARLLYSHRA